jgi:hypothetical protein
VLRPTIILSLIFFPIILSTGIGQETIRSSKHAKWDEKYEAGKLRISPALCPLYNPDLGFNFTGGLLLSFKTKPNNPYLSHSYLPIILSYNFHNQLISKASLNTFWADDLIRFDCDLAYQNLTDSYFGIGFQQIKDFEESGFPSDYKKNLFKVIPSLLIKTIPGLYIGIGFSIGEVKATELNNAMQEDLTILGQGITIKSIGAGFRLNYLMVSKAWQRLEI